MKRISIRTLLLLTINVCSVFSKHMESINNEENSIVIEWANDKSGRCQAFSIYEDGILLKTNIPIINNKINVEDLYHKHGKLTFKCDSFVKQKREVKDEAEILSSEENSIEESDTDDDSIINAIDNFFFPSSENEEENKESSNTIEKVFNNVDKSDNDNKTKSNTNAKDKNDNLDNNNETKLDTNAKDNNNNSNDDEGNSRNDKNGNDQQDNNDYKKQNNDKETEHTNSSKENENNKNENNEEKKDKDENGNDNKLPEEEEDNSDKNNKPVHIGLGISLSFLLTSGLFLSVMKIRKMSDIQLEINAQEMSADSVYVPSPRISNTGSLSLSMSSLELGNASSLQENSFGSTLNSFVV